MYHFNKFETILKTTYDIIDLILLADQFSYTRINLLLNHLSGIFKSKLNDDNMMQTIDYGMKNLTTDHFNALFL